MKYWILCGLLALASPAAAEENETFQPGDVLYAPEEMSPTADVAAPAGKASFYSTATIEAIDFGSSKSLLGAELFLDGIYVGKSPLQLTGFLVKKERLSLTARKEGYAESERPAFILPPEGRANIYLVGDHAVSWYTTPAFIAGLAMLAGSVAAYSQNSGELGLGLVAGGLGTIGFTQCFARFWHLPALKKSCELKNSAPESAP